MLQFELQTRAVSHLVTYYFCYFSKIGIFDESTSAYAKKHKYSHFPFFLQNIDSEKMNILKLLSVISMVSAQEYWINRLYFYIGVSHQANVKTRFLCNTLVCNYCTLVCPQLEPKFFALYDTPELGKHNFEEPRTWTRARTENNFIFSDEKRGQVDRAKVQKLLNLNRMLNRYG